MNGEKNSRHLFSAYVEAVYKPQKIEDYAGNPLIEALPRILETEEQVVDAFYSLPTVKPEERNLPPLLRTHVIKRVKGFIQPLPVHIKLESKISVLIRQSYICRNPIKLEYKKKLQLLNQLKTENNVGIETVENYYRDFQSTAECIFINGVSGMGKTTAIRRILQLYPQIIRHSVYNDQAFTRTQLVWIKIDCPYDGSFITLCRNVFQEIDRLTGSRWNEKYGYLTRSTSTMVMYLTTLLANYDVGLLVIDEIQNLYNAKGDPAEMLDFFVTLTNMFSVPIVFIGTNRARNLFQKNFRLARRVQSDGYIEIANLKKASAEWELFLESLWEFSVMEENLPLSNDVKEVFYNHCQGVIAVAVMLFMFSQNMAISKGKKLLTTEIIKKTADEDLNLIKPMLKALRSGNPFEIAKFDDITIDEDAILTHYEQNIGMSERVQEKIRQKKEELEGVRNKVNDSLYLEFITSGLFNSIKPDVIRKIIDAEVDKAPMNLDYEDLRDLVLELLQAEKKKLKKPKLDNVVSLEKQSLLVLFEQAVKSKQHPYEIFKKHGIIKNPITEFLKVE